MWGASVLGLAAEDNPEITVAMAEFEGQRRASNVVARAIGQKEKLVARGQIEVDGRSYAIYLPHPLLGYSTKNTLSGQGMFYNSTAIGVDHDGDGKLSPSENFFAHKPIRIGRSMYEVTSLARDGSEVRLRKAGKLATVLTRGVESTPLRIETTDGESTSIADVRGSALILKYWSPT